MFGHLNGKIFDLKSTKVIIKVGGIGFIIQTTPSLVEKMVVGQEIQLWTHTAVRENAIDLYGFENKEELAIFEMLLTVSGVGPKSALAILGVAGVKAIEEALTTKDISSLTKVSGVGRKTAEKIVFELGDKVSVITKGERATENIDVFEALKSLGYRDRDIQETIKKIPGEVVGANEKIKYALKNLGK